MVEMILWPGASGLVIRTLHGRGAPAARMSGNREIWILFYSVLVKLFPKQPWKLQNPFTLYVIANLHGGECGWCPSRLCAGNPVIEHYPFGEHFPFAEIPHSRAVVEKTLKRRGCVLLIK